MTPDRVTGRVSRRRTPRGVRGRALCGVVLLAVLAGCSTAPDQPPQDEMTPSEASEPSPRTPTPRPEPPPAAPDPQPSGRDAAIAEPEPTPPPVPVSREALEADVGRLLDTAREEAADGSLAVLVTDEYGREVLGHRADEAVLPASTLKIVTAAAALTTFGPDARFRTRVETTAPVSAAGEVDGDLLLVGSGDPALATPEYGRWVYPARPRTPLEMLADGVVAAGVTEVRGDLVGVADGFAGPNVAAGWPDRYFSSLDARYADGLTVDGGLRTILTYPEPEDPEPGEDSSPSADESDGPAPDDGSGDPATDEDAADDDVAGASADERDAAADERADPPPDVDPIVRVDHAADPASHAAAEFGRLLAERGVTVHGDPRSGAVDMPVVGRLATVESPPLEELLRFAVQRSDNQLTDGLFRAVGRARTGTGSFGSGDRALRQVLERFGIDHDRARFADGSGLSREDRATVRMLVELDRAMLASWYAGTWTSLMAVTGQSGTLRSRLQGTPADGRFAGKTGTLQDVSALVGTVHGAGPRRYHLAVVANDPGAARWVARSFADALILRLVADLDDG